MKCRCSKGAPEEYGAYKIIETIDYVGVDRRTCTYKKIETDDYVGVARKICAYNKIKTDYYVGEPALIV